MSSGSVPMPYQPRGQGLADQNYMSLFSGQTPWAMGAPGAIIPNLYADASAIQNNPYAPGMQLGANQAGAWAQGVGAPGMEAGATNLFGQGSTLGAQIPGVLQQGNDPQNALYNLTNQQTLDQTNAVNAASGVSGSPYSAGLDAQNLRNFNLDWGNNQLNRMSTADAAAGNLSGASSGAYGAGGNLATSGPQLGAWGSQLPYSTANMRPEAGMNAWNQAGQGVSNALAPGNTLMSDLGNYLGIGQNATRIGQAGQNQNWLQNAAMYQGLGQMLGFGGGGGWGGGGGNNFWQTGGQGFDIGDIMGWFGQ